MKGPAAGPRGLATAAMAREEAHLPNRGNGASLAMHLRPSMNGNTDLVNAETGEVVSPCASAAIAETTRAFFAK